MAGPTRVNLLPRLGSRAGIRLQRLELLTTGATWLDVRLNDLEFAPNVAAVLFMAGFIRTMQLVRQPLFDRVGADAFPTYETAHNRLFFLVARPGVLATFLSGVLLLFVRSSRHPFLGGPGARRAG